MKVFCVLLFGVAAVIAAPKIDPNVELRKKTNRIYYQFVNLKLLLPSTSAFDIKIK